MTYNMARNKCDLEMDKILPNPQQYDLIAIGLQEAKMGEQKKYLLKLVNYLEQYGFQNICAQDMWEIMLIVFVAKKHTTKVMEASIKTHRDGLLGMVGNKGGIQVTFSLYNRVFTFISGHLKHGKNAVDARNEMISSMLKTFKSKNEATLDLDSDIIADYSFIFGDLNYRFNTDFTTMINKVHEAPNMIEEYDQLKFVQRALDNQPEEGMGAYPDYLEPIIDFGPSYKKCKNQAQQDMSMLSHQQEQLKNKKTAINNHYLESQSVITTGANMYKKDADIKIKKAKKGHGDGPMYINGFKNKKNQAPSYTDRILFKNNTCQAHNFIKYGMTDDVWGSDHRPVYLDQTVSVRPLASMNEQQLINTEMHNQQMFGMIQFDEVTLKFISQRKFKGKRIIFAANPDNLTLQFFGDYLDQSGARSCVTQSTSSKYSWPRKEIPQLFTPLNTMQSIRERRLVIVASESIAGGFNKHQGQINLKLSMLKAINLDKTGMRPALYAEFKNEKVILTNNTVGYLSGRIKCQFITEQELQDIEQHRQQKTAIDNVQKKSSGNNSDGGNKRRLTIFEKNGDLDKVKKDRHNSAEKKAETLTKAGKRLKKEDYDNTGLLLLPGFPVKNSRPKK